MTMVGVTVFLDSDMLTAVEAEIKGKNRSEKIRKCIESGLQNLQRSLSTNG